MSNLSWQGIEIENNNNPIRYLFLSIWCQKKSFRYSLLKHFYYLIIILCFQSPIEKRIK